MRRIVLALGMLLMLAIAGVVVAQDAATPATPANPATPAAPAKQHVMTTPAGIKWGDPPPVFEKGASFTVLSGNPAEAGVFTVRLKMPAGYRINPHWHPADEHVTVISGTFLLGMGETFNKATMTSLPAGGYALLPAEMRHYAMAKTAVVVQVHGTGPFALTYVNPADDPSTRTAAPAGK
jgi:quercetin dioxygenase-like cupin family protein